MAPNDSFRRARPLLGTFVEIVVANAGGPETETAVEGAFEAIATVHRLMSFQETDSDVGRLNREAALHSVEVHEWTYRVLELSLDLYRRTAGVFDVTVARSLHGSAALWREPADPRSRECRSSSAIELLPERRVRFSDNAIRIDLSGIAKGFAVDRGIEALRSQGIATGLINAGGDLAAFGPRAQPLHIRDPRCPGHMMCWVEVANAALATSAIRPDFMQSSDPAADAIIDPQTRRPVIDILGASVLAPSCAIADALTKIVMTIGTRASRHLDHYGANALFVSSRGNLHITPCWQSGVHLAA
jgi:FAD:protein FMN transferase